MWVAVVSVAGYGWRWITFVAGYFFYLALLCMWTKGCEVHFVQKESFHFYLYVLVAIITVLQIRVGNYICLYCKQSTSLCKSLLNRLSWHINMN